MCSGAVTLDFLWVLVFFLFLLMFYHTFFFFLLLFRSSPFSSFRSANFFPLYMYLNSLKLFTFLLSLYCSLTLILLPFSAIPFVHCGWRQWILHMLFTGVNIFHWSPLLPHDSCFHLVFRSANVPTLLLFLLFSLNVVFHPEPEYVADVVLVCERTSTHIFKVFELIPIFDKYI